MDLSLPVSLERRFAATLERLERDRVVQRLWGGDHTLWSDSPEEIADRLGWLRAPEAMAPRLDTLTAFAREVWAEGVRDVVLLGMGGSSLGAECLLQALRPEASDAADAADSADATEAGPRLHVLDSTVPSWVRGVRAAIDPAKTFVLVASKSGTTIEARTLADYFWQELAEALGERGAGRRFAAITDPGTPLGDLAAEQVWRRVFENPPDVGGRFSVLTWFGLVPAALAGLPIGPLLAGARQEAGRAHTTGDSNLGLRLGALLGSAATAGHDLLTLLAPPRLAGFGLWVEQLVAESTGKAGRGIVPVAGEPLAAPERYGDDRLFVALSTGEAAGEDAEAVAAAGRLAAAGRPVATDPIEGAAGLGAALYRWQVATAVAGHLLAVHPFDQPDVAAAKANTSRLLADLDADGRLPRSAAASAAAGASAAEAPRPAAATDLAGHLEPAPRYLALMAYARPSAALEAAVGKLRRRVLERYGVATTFGYAPRLLHSTGQLHKGGPAGGLFVQLVEPIEDREDTDTEEGGDLAIPGRPYTFGTLAAAQALGDARALADAGRTCLRVDLGTDPAAAVAALL